METVHNKCVENIEQNCLICGMTLKNRKSLAMHLIKRHKEIKGLEEYTLKFILGNVPLCKCGCGQETKWHKTLCKFNDYITGHNHLFTTENQPVRTKEQSEKCAKTLKKLYENNDELRKRISESVKKKYVIDPEYRNKMSDAQKRIWSENREERSEPIRKYWRDHHDELIKKIFTPEFSKKISLANMRRKLNKTSKIETKIFEHIKTIWPKAQQGKWFNFSQKTWCVDIWIPEEKILLEVDGVYYHALDIQESSMNRMQLTNRENDISKNEIAISHGLNLSRLREDVNLDLISDVNSLRQMSYYNVINGKVQ